MRWNKKGLIYVPEGNFEWNKSHAQVPVVDMIDEKIWRIYFSTRNGQNKSNTSYIEVEAGNPQNILYIHNRPVLPLGRLGAFDEDGIMPSSIITINKKKYLYYIGWSKKNSVPYQNSIGLATSEDGGKTFEKYAEGPVIGISPFDPFFTGTIFVLPDAGIYKAYYLSCTEWKEVNGKPESVYVLKYAASKNGIEWIRENVIAIPLKNEMEGGIVSASVIKKEDRYHMWFGYRNYFDFRNNPLNSYRIGFAKSNDGITWVRNDAETGIDISETGWDSEMISYPCVIEFENELFMFYNGNHFGKTGFGYATSNFLQ